MALQSYGILGPVTQKIGNVVGGKWKNKHYFRTLVTPSNPNTAAQQLVRSNFSTLVALGRLILSGILQPYWDPFESGMSGFNRFIKVNMEAAQDPFDYADVVVARGALEGSAISGAVYATGDVTISFSSTTSGNGLSTDSVIGLVYDAGNNVAFTSTGNTRTDGETVVTVGTGRTVGDLKSWIFFHRGSGANLEVSNSSYLQVTT